MSAGTATADRRTRRRAERRRRILARAAALLGTSVAAVEYPGGPRRDTFRLILADGRRVIATCRADREDAAREVTVMRALGAHGARVPDVLAFDGRILIQSELPGERLPLVLDRADPATREALLDAALAGLAEIQRAGAAAGLEREVPAHGVERGEWLEGLLGRPAVFARFFGLPCPALPEDRLAEIMTVPSPRFIKWDARPGNAVVDDAGRLAWFDFEDCKVRRPLDDVAWLLTDEFTPDLTETEGRLLAKHAPSFADGLSPGDALLYLRVYGVFHSLVRLGLVLSRKDREPWWDWAYCLAEDKVGVSYDAALRLCRRAARWARAAEPVAALGDLLDGIAVALPPDDGARAEGRSLALAA